MIEATPTCAPIAKLKTPAESGTTSAIAVIATIACVQQGLPRARGEKRLWNGEGKVQDDRDHDP
jgi:hypothetical protein